MKKAAIALVVIGGLAAIVLFSLKQGDRSQGTKVDVESVDPYDIVELVKATGIVDARVSVNISSHQVGKIEKLYVEEGDEIRAGARFLELEKDALIAIRDDWASRLGMAENDVQQAEISLADSEIKARRAARLSDEGIMTSENLESAQLNLNSAHLGLARSRQAVLQAKAGLSKAKTDLSKTTIFSPLSGRVVSLSAEEGEVVVSGTMNNPASVIGVVADLSEILAEVDVDETEIVKVHSGQEATLTVDAVRDREYSGRVVEVGSSGFSKNSQPDVTFFKVKILFETPDQALRPGMSVRSDLRTASNTGVLAVPIQAVVERKPLNAESTESDDAEVDEIQVVFLMENGKAVQRPVEVGLTDDTHVEILEGLAAGDQVVTGPYRALKDLDHDDDLEVRSKSAKDRDSKKDDEEDA